MHSLIVFASGKGSNAAAIVEYFRNTQTARVALIVTNKADAGVVGLAEKEGIPVEIIDRNTINAPSFVTMLQSYDPSLIILAGFLWKIPDAVIAAFRNRIINIHPALLPDFGGKGMYGHHVHNAVVSAGKNESGVTIHYVDEVYDNGDIIVQARCPVLPADDATSLAVRIHALEHYFFPRTIEFLLASQVAGKD
jgi:phosphoribosylglycinamide formyltransferase-1